MTDEQLFVRLATHAGPADMDGAFEERLYELLQGEMRRSERGSQPVLLLVAALMLSLVIGGIALFGGARVDESSLAPNGWIAFTVEDALGDLDIWFVALDQSARRVIGTESDFVDQMCPAFSPDGLGLAYGQPGQLVIGEVSADGHVTDRLTVDVDNRTPCPIWSPDGGQVAFGVNDTSPINPTTSAAGSEVWIVSVADGSITALPDLLATDLEWSPDGRYLAIASGVDANGTGNQLHDGRISLFAPASGTLRQLDSTLGAMNLTWSPDGGRMAYSAITGSTDNSLQQLRIIDVETEDQRVVTDEFVAFHGIGPVWSPDGETIVYQRQSGGGGERHDVVLLTPVDPADQGANPHEVVLDAQVFVRGDDYQLYPFRVTWSPDGEDLQYVAWGMSTDEYVGPLLAVVPVDQAKSPRVLVLDETVNPYDGYPDTTFVPIQTWARQPADGSAEPSATEPEPSADDSVPPLPSADALVSEFLEARVVGAAAEPYLSEDSDEIPLLYETTSGARYERAEFEPVAGYTWPYGLSGYSVRLFAGDTVVEQLIFTGSEVGDGLRYQWDGFRTDIPPTTENGQSLPLPYTYFDGEVSLHVAHPWFMSSGEIPYGLLVPEGPGVPPTTDGGERILWADLQLLADPLQAGANCQEDPAVDAEALAESIRSRPDLEASGPVFVNGDRSDALMMDVVIPEGTGICTEGVLGPVYDPSISEPPMGVASGERLRLYLFDAPEGSSMRVLVVAITAGSDLERAVEAAGPIIDSIEFHAP